MRSMATTELQGLLPGQVGDDLGVMEEDVEFWDFLEPAPSSDALCS